MTKRTLTRKEARQAEARKFAAQVEATLAEAHRAAAAAAIDFLKTAKRAPERHVADLCGSASVGVFRPSYRLREALKALGEIRRDYDGAWWISDFSRQIDSQSVTAHERACSAACSVFKRAFPSEGQFFSRARID